MNKLTLNKKALAFIVLLCLLLAQSCRKDRYLPDDGELGQKQVIKEELINKWYETNPVAKLISLNWSKARQTVINGKNVVRVPTFNVDKISSAKKTAILKANLMASNGLADGVKKSAIASTPAGNPNYYSQHPPEVIFLQTPGEQNLHSFLLNFIPNDVSKEFGENGIWTGKMVEWNLTGDTIFVQKIEKSVLKEKYLIKAGKETSVNNISDVVKTQKLQSLEGLKDKTTSNIFTWLLDKLEDAIGWVGNLFGLSYWAPSNVYGQTAEDGGYRISPINMDYATGGGGGGGGGSSNGGYSGGYYGAGMGIYGSYSIGYTGDGGAYGMGGYDPNTAIYTEYPIKKGGPNFTELVDYIDDGEYQFRQQALSYNTLAIKTVEEEMWLDQRLTDAQVLELAQVVSDQLTISEYYTNLSEVTNISNLSPDDDDPPFWEKVKGMIRRYLMIDQPKNTEEAQELDEMYRRSAYLKSEIARLHETHQKIFFFVPGYSALDNLVAEQNYSASAVDLSIDLFGGTLVKGMLGPLFKLSEKYTFKTTQLALKYPNIANRLKLFNIKEFHLLKRSTSDKVIVLGEDMANRVSPARDLFYRIFKGGETFPASPAAEAQLDGMKQFLGRNLTKDELKSTMMYIENQNWLKDKLAQGYNVIDIGPKIPNTVKSPFYEMERSLIYAK